MKKPLKGADLKKQAILSMFAFAYGCEQPEQARTRVIYTRSGRIGMAINF
jgi:hypothetical protein